MKSKNLLATLPLIVSTFAWCAQKESTLTPEQNQKNIIARVKERLKDSPLANISELSAKLILHKQYGPELADLLDLTFGIQEYTYLGQGIYKHARGPAVHSYPRHMCEPEVTEQIAEKAHNKYEPPSYVSPDGTRHYAFMH
ncbi:MAG: hypothetical protein AMXMBFR12_10530 [Candidatus Babeliales bacterium]